MTKGTWEQNNTLLRESGHGDRYYTTSLQYGGKQHTDWAMRIINSYAKYSMHGLYAVKEDDWTINLYIEDDGHFELSELGEDLANETEADRYFPIWDECSEDDYCDAMMKN